MDPQVHSSTDANAVISVISGAFCGATASEPKEESQKIPVLTTDFDSPFYNMNRKRGVCVIFNHYKFCSGLSERSGTGYDKGALVGCFTRLGYQIIHCDDYKYNEIIRKLQDLARMDHTAADSFVCCVLTHGNEGMLHAYDETYDSVELYDRFRGDVCPSLCGKPKIFIIQACQGLKEDKSVLIVSDSHSEPVSRKYHTVPTMADFLIALSTAPGYCSWRDFDRGSWYIQHLVGELLKNDGKDNAEKEDLVSILTTVNRRVAYDAGMQATQTTFYKQMPCFQSTLTRKVTFPSNHE